DHTFDLAGVAPGTYAISLMSFGGALRSFARQIVEVGNSDLDDLVLTVMPSGTIRGQVHVEGTPPAGNAQTNLAQVHLMLSPASQGRMFSFAQSSVKADGSFVLENVTPGVYYPQAMNGPDGTYLKSIRYGQQEVLGKDLDLTQNTGGDLQVVFSYGPAEVDGTVQAGQDAPTSPDANAQAPSASVILIPDTLNADGSGVQSASANQNGVFSIKQVSPGHYRALALEQINWNQLQNPDVLKQLAAMGTEIEAKENDKKQIQLKIIPAADIQELLARLGIDQE
ncbi:MAG: hypothetical protein M3Y27_13550, partial [Acidobacteriota bacterium]|nr:hypothetical protein [Acidobacteriota bacterium]